jgi:V/A-type H+-transporting ATPase subunit F
MGGLMVVTDSDTALGFRLAGVEVTEAAGADDAAERLLALLKTKGPGIVLYNEEYRSALSEDNRTTLEESIIPVFFAMPVARAGRTQETREVYLARLLRRAIGYQLKIKR